MSYIILTKQFKENLQTKIVRYIKDELKGNDVLFDQKFQVSINEEEHGDTMWICEGITGEGQLFGRTSWGDEVEWDVYGMEVEELAYVLDQLLEVNYSVLQPES